MKISDLYKLNLVSCTEYKLKFQSLRDFQRSMMYLKETSTYLEEYMKELEVKKPALMEKIENLGKEYNSTKSLRKRDPEKLIMLLKGAKENFERTFEFIDKDEYKIR